jgi:hypothetical protein
VAQPRITRDDVISMVEARRELDDEMEPAVVDAFLDRVEAAIDARAAERRPARGHGPGDAQRLALSIVSLGTGIPITAIAAESGGVVGIVAAWAGIAGVNFAYSRGRRD